MSVQVSAFYTMVHKFKFIAEKFYSIQVEGSTLCKHHKQLHPSKCILCRFLTWDQVVQSLTEVIQYDNEELMKKWPICLTRGQRETTDVLEFVPYIEGPKMDWMINDGLYHRVWKWKQKCENILECKFAMLSESRQCKKLISSLVMIEWT